jgi:peptide/nickel transport system permease protein
VPAQAIFFIDHGRVYPDVLGLTSQVDPEKLHRTYVLEPRNTIPLQFFVRGTPYHLFGIIPAIVLF